MAEFILPKPNCNPDLWGPRANDPSCQASCLTFLEKLPFDTSLKVEKLGRVCDFTLQAQRWRDQQDKRFGRGETKEEDVDVFKLVDTTKAPKSKYKGYVPRGRGGFVQRGGAAQRGGLQQWGQKGVQQKAMQQNQRGGAAARGRGGRFGNYQRFDNRRTFREWSVQTQPEWLVEQEIQMSALGKLSCEAKKIEVEDIMWCGQLRTYDRTFDRVSPKQEKALARFESTSFYNVTTSADPHLTRIMTENSDIKVVATDHLLSCLMSSTRSSYSWDIICLRVEDRLIFDKRDGSTLDILTVNETALEPPSQEAKEAYNHPVKLGLEASCINQNYSQMVLDRKETPTSFEPHPFVDEGETPACTAYRYRQFVLPANERANTEVGREPIKILVRTEVDAKLPNAENSYASLKALNEYDPKVGLGWRNHLETQSGAVLANEIRNNSCKLARWCAQSLVAGVDTLKLGYVSRVTPKDPFNHALLNVQTYKTEQFATQLGMTQNNAWGIVRGLIDVLLSMKEGKYLILKDPNRPVVRLYSLPWSAFEESGDEEEAGGEADGGEDK